VTPDVWDEDELLAVEPPVKPSKALQDPHLAYTQGPAGQTITDWKAFGGNATPEQLVPHSTVEDRRDNRDPEEVWFEILERREKVREIHGGYKVVDEIAGQMSMEDSG
jgi:hypothetical protein